MANASLEEAVGKAMEEAGAGAEEAPESTEKVSESPKGGTDEGSTDEPPAETTDAEKDTDAASDGEDKASSDESEAPAEEKSNVEPQEGKATSEGGARKTLLNQLLEELKADERPQPKQGPRDVTEVNLQDPQDVQKWMDERVTHAVEQALKPVLMKNAQTEAQLELRALVQKFPDAPKHGQALAAKIKQYPNMPLEEAYKLVTYDSNRKAGKQEAIASMDKKKAANLMTTTTKKPPDSAKPIKSSRDAVLRAMEEHGV